MARTIQEIGGLNNGGILRGHFECREAIVTDAFSASITPDADQGWVHRIIATSATAPTINAPLNPEPGRWLCFDIKNSSGGVMGNVTFDAVFLLAGGFTKPVNGTRRTISFYFDGTNWVEVHRAALDI